MFFTLTIAFSQTALAPCNFLHEFCSAPKSSVGRDAGCPQVWLRKTPHRTRGTPDSLAQYRTMTNSNMKIQ
jgi:hypothetical protein